MINHAINVVDYLFHGLVYLFRVISDVMARYVCPRMSEA